MKKTVSQVMHESPEETREINDMMLGIYKSIFRKLNYKNISSEILTEKVLTSYKNNGRKRTRKHYSSQVIFSLEPPIGKSYCIIRNAKSRKPILAETKAVNMVTKYLDDQFHTEFNNLHVNDIVLSYKPPINNLPQTHNNLIKELPFYCLGQQSTGFNNNSWQRHYNGNYEAFNQRRYYSTVHSDNATATKRQETINPTHNCSTFDDIHAEILKVPAFVAPKNYLGNIYEHVGKILKSDKPLRTQRTERVKGEEWKVTLEVSWPTSAAFYGTAKSKKEASRRASVLCIEWLLKTGKIDNRGQMRMVENSEVIEKQKKPLTEIFVNELYVQNAESLIKEFADLNLPTKLSDEAVKWKESELELCTDFGKNVTNRNLSASESLLLRRNRELYSRLQKRSSVKQQVASPLPIMQYRDKIRETIKNNRVIVIKGETGCGKSTQVPQFIMDDLTAEMKATDCNIVVTQPRRISAISLAERIAYEREELIGDVVGYHVRLQSQKPRRDRSSILFCSTGIMLRKLLSEPDMAGISHFIIDEAHERDLNTDLILLLTKRAVERNPNLKVIIMSATINPELFQNYFKKSASLHIPGFTHPVTSHFYDSEIGRITGLSEDTFTSDFPVVDVKAVGKLVSWINSNKGPGAILVFLPGWSEIKRLNELLSFTRNLLVLPLHSRLSHADQRKIFSRPPLGLRKVILSTNIAETSITIDDVIYVIDCGAQKEERLSAHTGALCLDNQWISQANAKQRRGRAGRIRPGECYHLYSQEKFNTFSEFPIPEVHRVRLESVVLQSKIYSGNEKAEEFLNSLPEPPTTEMIRDSVTQLQYAGALDENENLTALGTRIAVFTTHPFLSKALVHSYLFKCVNPMVTIATLLSSDVELFPGTMGDKTAVREVKKKFSPTSDHLALAWLFEEWEYFNRETNRGHNYENYEIDHRARALADSVGANNHALLLISKLRNLIAEHLYQCGFLAEMTDFRTFDSDCNKYLKNHELTKGVLLSGIGNVLASRNWDIQKGVIKKKNVFITDSGQRATISSESVNFRRVDFPTPFMTYFTEVRSLQQRTITIRDTSLISPVTLVLFQCTSITINKCTDSAGKLKLEPTQVIISLTNNRKKLNIVCDERTANILISLRQIMWSIVDYLVREEGNPQNQDLLDEIKVFHDKLLALVDKILHEQSLSIDYNEEGVLRT